MVVVWLWPAAVLLFTFHWHRPCVGLRLLCKSTWVLYAGVLQGWIVVLTHLREDKHPDPRVTVFIILSVISLFALPFGLGRWEYRGDGYMGEFGLSTNWYYIDNLFLSFMMHLLPVALVVELFRGALVPVDGRPGNIDTSIDPSPTGSGLWGRKSWLDDVWKGGQISDEYFGHRGEFDLNDEARRVSEDMQQFHNSHPDTDLSDHYYWDDVLDAETDDYLD